jgi:predicted MFS family arabinose efflux permease
LGDRVPYERRGRILAYTEFGWSLAFVAGMPLIGLVITRWGWRAPFPLLLGLGLISFVILSRLLTNDGSEQTADRHLGRNLRRILISQAALTGLVFSGTLAASNEVVSVIYGVWIEGSFQLSTAALGATAAVIGVAELGGEFLVSVVIDRLGKSRAMIIGLMVNAAAAGFLAAAGGTITGALVGLFCFSMSFEFMVVSSAPMMTEIVPEARATFMGAVIACLSLGRALAGLLSAPLFAHGLEANLIVSLLFNLGAMLALWQLNRRGIV